MKRTTSPSNFEKLVLERDWLQESIDYEYDLNDKRLNALLIFNAILFAVFGIVVEIGGEISNKVFFVLMGSAILGAIVSFLSIISTKSGINQIEKLKDRRTNLFAKLRPYMDVPVVGADCTDTNHKNGLIPVRFFPILLTVSWLILISWMVHNSIGSNVQHSSQLFHLSRT